MKSNKIGNMVQRGLGLGAGLALAAGSAQASIDTSAVTSAMTDAGAAIALVGAAYLVVKVGVKVYKWISGAM
jgi:hypothetical protein